MVFERIEKLKQDYTDKFVVVDETRPELKRFVGISGRVRTINMSGRALVQFDRGDNNIGWYDIEVDYLKVIDKPLPSPTKEEKPPKGAAKEGAKPAAKAAAKPTGDEPKSTADILAAARGQKTASAKDRPAVKDQPAKKMGTADILAAARGKQQATEPKGSSAATTPSAAKTEPTEKAATQGQPAKRMSTADILAAARGNKPAAAAAQAKSEPVEAAEPAPAAEEDAVAQAEPEPVVEPAAEEAPPASAPQEKPPVGDLPTDTAGIIAWCREHDGG